jgi:hypothetical protein
MGEMAIGNRPRLSASAAYHGMLVPDLAAYVCERPPFGVPALVLPEEGELTLVR